MLGTSLSCVRASGQILVFLSPPPPVQECLEAFSSSAESRFGSLLTGGHVLCATEQWWQLAAQEAMLLVWLVRTLPPHTSRDLPVYLPHGSPTVSKHRLGGKEVGGEQGLLIFLVSLSFLVPFSLTGSSPIPDLPAGSWFGGGAVVWAKSLLTVPG